MQNQKIVPHLWFDTQAKEAAGFYTSIFSNSKVDNVTTLHDTPSGDCDIVSFTLAGQKFMAISAGPYFKINPSISLFVTFSTPAEVEKVWNKLIDGGKAMMALDKYPWADKYGWLQDKYGLTWQLSCPPFDTAQGKQKITPSLMFTQSGAGKAKEAIEFYTSIFKNSKTEALVPYEKGEGDKEGFIKHGRFMLEGQLFMAMDSSGPHEFIFNEAVSLIVNCDTQEEIDYFWGELSAVPESEQCGWLKDKFGVSWQITSRAMDKMMTSGDPTKTARMTQALLKMKKINIAELEKAANGK